MSPTVTSNLGSIGATLKVAFAESNVNKLSPAYSAVTVYLPAASPGTDKIATPFVMV